MGVDAIELLADVIVAWNAHACQTATDRRYDCGFHESFSDGRKMKATVQRTRKNRHVDVTEEKLRVGTGAGAGIC